MDISPNQNPVFITGDEPVFPNNAVAVIQRHALTQLPIADAYMRPLRSTDPDQAFFVFPDVWRPNDDSYEIGNDGFPTLERYTIAIQTLILDADEGRGGARHAALSELVRTMIYSNKALRVELRGLRTSLAGMNKSVQRIVVNSQKYYANSGGGQFAFASQMELMLEVSVTSTAR